MVSIGDSDAKGGKGGSGPPVVDLSDDSNSGSNSNSHNAAANVSIGAGGKTSAGTREGRRGSREEILSDQESGGGGGGGGGGSEGQIRVGKDYQVNPTNFIPLDQRRIEQCPERALLVWSPNDKLTRTKLDEYIQVAKEQFGYNAEQALGMLFWHKHDLDRAMQDLANFTPFPDEWTVEDKVLFEQAFQFHGKSFHRIRQMLPDKSIAQLVKYYYGWKKTRTRTSLMDRQARKLQVQREQGSVPTGGVAASGGKDVKAGTEGSPKADGKDGKGEVSKENTHPSKGEEDAVMSDDDVNSALGTEMSASHSSKPKCFNCGILCHVTHATPKGQMCGTCHQYFQRTGNIRPTAAPMRRGGGGGSGAGGNSAARSAMLKAAGNYSNKPPKGIYINHDDLVSLATGSNTQGEQILKSMDREIVSYKRVVQNNKQLLSMMGRKAKETRLKRISAGRLTNPYDKSQSATTPPAAPVATTASSTAVSSENASKGEETKSEEDPSPSAESKTANDTTTDSQGEESRINAKWTSEELLLGVQGVRTFGKDFHAIAEVIGTKTDSHVRSFYVNYRRKYNLDAAVKEYESANGNSGITASLDSEMTDDSKDTAASKSENGKVTNGASK